MPNTAGKPVNMAPYKVQLRDGKYVVLNNGGEVKGTHATRDGALAQLRALYAAVPGAGKAADRKPWTGKQKRAVKAAEQSREGDPQATAKDKDPHGGLSAAGRKKFGVKKGVTNYSGAGEEDKKRWVRWALRFTKTPRPLKDDNGKPTRYALMFQAWGEPIPTSTSAVSAVHTKAISRAKTLGMGQYEKAETFYFEHDWEPVEGHPVEVATCALCGLNRWSDEHMEQSKEFPAFMRDKLADKGKAMPGGAFPIENEKDLRNAIAAVGRAKDPAAAKAHIKKRAAALGKTALLPESWRQKSGQETLRAPLDALTLARLTSRYGVQSAAGMGASVSPLPPVGTDEDGDNDTKAEEDAEIKASQGVPAAKEPHPFMAAQYPDEAGHPRCRLCGLGTPAPVHADFQPEQRVTAQAGRTITLTTPGQPIETFTYTGGALAPLPQSAYAAHSTPLVVHERLAPVVKEAEEAPHGDERVKAFVTEANGKTLITGPASAFYQDRELALASNEHFLWMNGRFVGAEKANRNGALWTTDDLELGQVSVKHGPLNWLHEARHVIGTIADARMHTQSTAADQPLDQPYIEAASVIWKWIYPDEAWVVEQASDANKLWYSMECVSKEVACAGLTGCGATASYGDYLAGKGGTCDHMRERSGTRRFANPTFLGGAVIVPPVRPGWAEADASVMRTAASLAEKAFDQAGQPDVKAAEWEQLMAQVLRFAGA